MNKKNIKHLLTAALIILFATINTNLSAQNNASYITHEVKAGETLYGISQNYGISVRDILNSNPGMSENILSGQSIKIPNKNQGQYIRHTIVAGETLYGISSKYGIASKSIIEANPGLSATNFKTGSEIIIPANGAFLVVSDIDTIPGTRKKGCKLMYEVQKKETIYSISKKFNITEEDLYAANPVLRDKKLKKNMVICIPYEANEVYKEPDNETVFKENKPKTKKYSVLNVAVILPFHLSQGATSSESQKMIDFYEGFLLAVDSLRTRGVSVNVYTYDEDESIEAILNRPMMSHMQAIIGPGKNTHIASLSNFADKYNIPLIVPFSSQENIATNHKTIFQVNAPNTIVNTKVFNTFISQYKNDNIIFLGMSGSNDRSDFINEFKKALESKNIPYSNINFASIDDEIMSTLKEGKQNIIIPSSASQDSFEMLTYKLNTMSNTIATYNISLFGYPDWQTFNSKAQNNLSKYQCKFYATFYAQENSNRLSRFNRKFSQWFKRNQYDSYPKYALLGYDIGAYFLGGLHEQGSDFTLSGNKQNYASMQNPFYFERKNNWSGFVNNSIMFVRHTASGSTNVKVYK